VLALHLTTTGELVSIDPTVSSSAIYTFLYPNHRPSHLSTPPPKTNQSKEKQPKAKVPPRELDIEGPSSNTEYESALVDSSITFSPQALGFLPSNYWLAVDVTFGDLVKKFFQRKNNANARFTHKLYNALIVVDHSPTAFNLFGVQWITNEIFKVDKFIFARLLGIAAIDGGLFYRQGNFPQYGFEELNASDIDLLRPDYDLSDVDLDRVRLIHHRTNGFIKGGSEDAISRCKWTAVPESET
jgi:hypothetical protein